MVTSTLYKQWKQVREGSKNRKKENRERRGCAVIFKNLKHLRGMENTCQVRKAGSLCYEML